MDRKEPIYMKFIRRSQEKKRERERALNNNISAVLKESIGYKILLRMGWLSGSGLGKNGDGRVTLDSLIKRRKVYQGNVIDYETAEAEYNKILKSRNVTK